MNELAKQIVDVVLRTGGASHAEYRRNAIEKVKKLLDTRVSVPVEFIEAARSLAWGIGASSAGIDEIHRSRARTLRAMLDQMEGGGK
jgi:hypothetical protein